MSTKPGRIITSFASQIHSCEAYKLPINVDRGAGTTHLLSASTDSDRVIDISWLPAASKEYDISPDIRDYTIAEVPIVEGDVPNRNMHCFTTDRLKQFLPKYGCIAAHTFIGKPTFREHDHADNKKAKGVIFDAALRVINGRTHVVIWKGFCRQKDPLTANNVGSGLWPGHSMSAWAAAFDCSSCGKTWDTSYSNACDCAKGPYAVRDGKNLRGFGLTNRDQLTFGIVNGFVFFESSSVGDPANYAAAQLQHQAAQFGR